MRPVDFKDEFYSRDNLKSNNDLYRVVGSYKNKETRPLSFGELCLILERFKIMIEDEPKRFTVEEFIEQEDHRRTLFL